MPVYRFDKQGNLISKKTKKIEIKFNPETDDPFLHYREDEIKPIVKELLCEARKKRGCVYIMNYSIDELIRIQNEDVLKACDWIKWKFLGTASYLDVYGSDAEEKRKARAKEAAQAERIENIEKKLDLVLSTLAALTEAHPKMGATYESNKSIYISNN